MKEEAYECEEELEEGVKKGGRGGRKGWEEVLEKWVKEGL